MPNCYRVLDLFWQNNILAKPRTKMSMVSRFSRQNDAGLRALNVSLWENLVLVVVLVLGSKGPWMFIATTSNFHDGMLLYTVHSCLSCAASNYKITTYIDNEENCNNQQGTCCIVFPEYPIYRNIVRYKDRRSARMNPKGYNRTLKERKISYFNSLLRSNHFQWQRIKNCLVYIGVVVQKLIFGYFVLMFCRLLFCSVRQLKCLPHVQYNLFSHPRNNLILGSRCRCYLSYLLFLYATEIDRKWVSGVQHDYFCLLYTSPSPRDA